jgi:hypothetical protein
MPTVLGLMQPKIEWNEAESNSIADGNSYIGPDAIFRRGVFSSWNKSRISLERCLLGDLSSIGSYLHEFFQVG